MNVYKMFLNKLHIIAIITALICIAHLDAGETKSTALVYNPDCLKHDTGKNHPEKKERLDSIINNLKEKGLYSRLTVINAAPAPIECIAAVHSAEYIKEAEQSCLEGKKYLHSKDTIISEDSYNAARLAAGGVLTAIDAVMKGEVQNAFCAVRPPGHHASKNKAMGFCIFNNVAIGARYAQEKYKLTKILIVDFDVHHGNGTQDIFYEDPSVLYFSIHRSPFYPGTGNADEKGKDKGFGYTLNVPLSKGSGDKEYINVFEEILKPKAIEFKPDFIFISAGFDASKGDPLGGMNVTPDGYAAMTAIVKEIAASCCNGRIVSVLEGGYGLKGLADSVEAHISVLADKK